MGLTKNQSWIIIGIVFGLFVINGYLVYGLFTKKVELDVTCPIPKDKISFCDCVYDALVGGENNKGEGDLRYCYCYPGKYKINFEDSIKVINGTGWNYWNFEE